MANVRSGQADQKLEHEFRRLNLPPKPLRAPIPFDSRSKKIINTGRLFHGDNSQLTSITHDTPTETACAQVSAAVEKYYDDVIYDAHMQGMCFARKKKAYGKKSKYMPLYIPAYADSSRLWFNSSDIEVSYLTLESEFTALMDLNKRIYLTAFVVLTGFERSDAG